MSVFRNLLCQLYANTAVCMCRLHVYYLMASSSVVVSLKREKKKSHKSDLRLLTTEYDSTAVLSNELI